MISVSRRIAHGDSDPRPRHLSRPSLDRIVSRAAARAIARLGEGPWKGVYSLISAIGFVLIVWGFARARYDAPQLWTPPPEPAHHDASDADRAHSARELLFKRSHIAVMTHHPMLWSVLLWSAGHLFANGSAADLVLFGAFLVWSAAISQAHTPETGGTASSIRRRSSPPPPAPSLSAWSPMPC